MRMKVWGEISGERHLVGTLETIPGREEQFSYADPILKARSPSLSLCGCRFGKSPFRLAKPERSSAISFRKGARLPLWRKRWR